MKTKRELVSIKRVVFAWFFFFIICCNCKANSYSSPESTFTSKAADGYKHLGINETQQKKGYGSKLMMKPNKESDRSIKRPTSSRAYKTLQEAVQLGNVQRSGNELIYQTLRKANKGVYGGGDLLHHRSKKGAASSIIRTSSSSFLSIAFEALTIVMLVFVFY